MKRFLKWQFSWRNARRALISLALLVTLYAIFRAEENWRGDRAWNQYRRQLEAQGVQLDLAAFTPKPVSDDQNFAAIPLIKDWFIHRQEAQARWKADSYGRVSSYIRLDDTSRDPKRHFTDLVGWQAASDALRSGGVISNRTFESNHLDLASRAKAAPAILDALSTNDALFAELRAASQRPYSRYPIDYNLDDPWAILLPHLNCVRNICRRLELKACAELAMGRNNQALEDVKFILFMADSVKSEPFIVSALVRIACLQLAVQPVWEGLAEHAWSEAQLEELRAHFSQFNFIADMETPLSGERAAGVLTPDLVRKQGAGLLISVTGPGSPTPSDIRVANVFGRIIPSGWYSMEQVNYCRFYQLLREGDFDGAQKRVFPGRIVANTKAMDQAFTESSSFGYNFIHHRIVAQLLVPGLSGMMRHVAAAQTSADQAALACALERYRLANGAFPETLDALVPQFVAALPHDVITGEPYKYRRTSDGQFVLYSVGWNEKDDGGVPGKQLFDEKEGDWVWQYPSTQ